MSHSPHDLAALELWQSIQLRGDELEAHLTRATDPAYWRALAPQLSIEAPIPRFPNSPITQFPNSSDCTLSFERDGYVQLPSLLPPEALARMRSSVSAVRLAGWPAVFAWMYDEFWHSACVAPVVTMLTAILGEGYRQTPYLWTHIVSGDRGAVGWPPHPDNTGDDLRVTVWIPLTDATVETGCISLIPRHAEPFRARWYEREALPMKEVMSLLHAVRALPATAGSVLAWDAGLVHWGSPRQAEGDPRIAVGMEFVPPSAPASVLEDSLGGAGGERPSFDNRLAIVARNIALYQRNEPRVGRFVPLADSLLERFAHRRG